MTSQSHIQAFPCLQMRCGIKAVDGRAKKKTKDQSQVTGTRWNSQPNNEEMVSMMSLNEMHNPKSYTPPSKGTRQQRKRAGVMNYGNKRKATEMAKDATTGRA
jgi:hypothetical protein